MKKRRGFVIAVALVIALALMLMIGALTLSVTYRHQIILGYINSIKAYYMAASCGATYAEEWFEHMRYWTGTGRDTELYFALPRATVTIHAEPMTEDIIKRGIMNCRPDICKIHVAAKVRNSTTKLVFDVMRDELIETYAVYPLEDTVRQPNVGWKKE